MNLMVKPTKEYCFDVCVLGGGPAGFTAATAAASCGAETVLVEKYGMLGGAMTVGGVPLPGLFHAPGRQVIAGIGWKLITRLAEKGWAVLPQAPYRGPHPAIQVKVNGFQAACEMDDMCAEAGVTVLFHHQAVFVQKDGQRLRTVFLTGHEGLTAVHAEVFVDCTGDGDIAFLSGAPFEKSTELQPGSLNVTFTGIDLNRVNQEEADAKFAEAVASGRLKKEDVWSGNGQRCGGIWNGMGSNLNHVYPLDGADGASRAQAERKARASVRRLLEWMREEIPGCENAEVSACCPESWARESRRILGESYITVRDYVAGVIPENAVCYSYYPIDVHSDGEKSLNNIFLEEGRVPGIPYGALTARNCDNLLVAGRCISGDREAQSAYRVQATCMATGQAAGTAAAMAVRMKLPVHRIPISALRKKLSDQGAIVPDLCKEI